MIQDEFKREREALLESLSFPVAWGVAEVRTFMESHVWAVWDFMSLVKQLQRELTCVELPWRPVGDAKVRRFINEIVLGEESDFDRHGNPASHFEMYLRAMNGVGASTSAISAFLEALQRGDELHASIDRFAPSEAVARFVHHTFDVVHSRKLHVLAAVFTFGREDLIPDMFTSLVRELSLSASVNLDDLRYYLERHIEVDGDEHGPIALKLVEATLAGDVQRKDEAMQAAIEALRLRKALWNDIQERMCQPLKV